MHRHALPTRALAAAAGLSLAVVAPAIAVAHSGHAKKKPAPRTQKVDIAFGAVAGTQPVACGTPIAGLGTTNQAAQLRDLRFFVSDVRLVKASGFEVPVKLTPSAFQVTRRGGAVTLIDLENGTGACAEDGNAALNPSVRGTVPAGRYTGVRWTVGVPFALNHTDVAAAPAPLNSTAMGWSWQVGRKFTKIEVTDPAGGGAAAAAMHMRQHGGMPAAPGAPAAPAAPGAWQAGTFFVHLGSVGCSGNPATGQTVRCTTPNRAHVRLGSFNPARQRVAVDVKALLAGNDITVNRANAPGCMSGPKDPECGGVFRSLGVSWKADGTGTGASPAARQTVFRAIGR
ncbi:hypothetical protein DSM112329_02000 [Paraconexibacter sp. AEG42_29]|uniref:Copper-binding protein MbnP-like domain-containing protein n=1 Tax=Paraconexibacter sp. AEG42_29 TaxID=2997339 RepID=A0AAU7AU73_9ACTN